MSDRPAFVEAQYANAAHQAVTSIDGMWLFLATELLFFGGLFLTWTIYRIHHPAGFSEATGHTNLLIGSINTALLLCSSFSFTLGLAFARRGNNRVLARLALVTVLLGLSFLALKGIEWWQDLDEHLFPGSDFGIRGNNSGAAQLFYSFYFVATGLHGVHLAVGIGLVGWIAWRARAGEFSPAYCSPVEVVGLFWSFVDLMWLILYPLIYLQGRP